MGNEDDNDSQSSEDIDGKISSKLTNYKTNAKSSNNYSFEKTKAMANDINELYKEAIHTSSSDNSFDNDKNNIINLNQLEEQSISDNELLDTDEDDDNQITSKINDLKIRNDYIKNNN